MGSGFSACSYEEAAKILGKSKRSVYAYVKSGLIRKTYNADLGQTLLITEDVEQLKKERGLGLPPINNTTVHELVGRVTKLERDMSVARKMLDINFEPLRLQKDNAVGLLTEALVSLRDRFNKWSNEEIVAWVSIFGGIDTITLDAIKEGSLMDNPWQAFYELCTGMLECSKKRLNQGLIESLSACRISLRKEIVLWLEMGKGRLIGQSLRPLDTHKEALLRRLASKGAKGANP